MSILNIELIQWALEGYKIREVWRGERKKEEERARKERGKREEDKAEAVFP